MPQSSNRPMSPHLQVYRPQITSVLSITHRACGVALAVGTLLLAWYLLAAASGPESFAVAHGFITSIIGRVLLFGWSFALFYHLSNGIRHLAWDLGYGLEIETLTRTGFAVVLSASLLTLAAWVAAYLAR